MCVGPPGDAVAPVMLSVAPPDASPLIPTELNDEFPLSMFLNVTLTVVAAGATDAGAPSVKYLTFWAVAGAASATNATVVKKPRSLRMKFIFCIPRRI